MTHLDPASNPGSKPQKLSDITYKSCKLETKNKFWHF
jgi:hypothetical protein